MNKIILSILTLVVMSCMTIRTTLASEKFFSIQSIDTMKESRDLSREKLRDEAYEESIRSQVAAIAATGATHVAVGTPYEEEFVPFLKKWVAAARLNNIHVWFRGNLAGWEGWFEYPKIDRATHTAQTLDFIKNNPKLFKDGDIFVSCPECENGGPGDPRLTGDVEEYRKFLINEHEAVEKLFKKMGLDITTNLYSMNGDVALLVMDKETTSALGGVVTIDHYVETPQKMAQDTYNIIEQSGGKIVYGEIGAPILDIHNEMTAEKQAEWINGALYELAQNPDVIGINYWVNKGGSTQIWNDDNSPRSAVGVISRYFKPRVVSGKITDDLKIRLRGVKVVGSYRDITLTGNTYEFPILDDQQLTFEKKGYKSVVVNIDLSNRQNVVKNIVMYPESPSWFYNIMKKIRSVVGYFKN